MIVRLNARADVYDGQYADLAKAGGAGAALPPILPALATLRTLPGGYEDRNAAEPWSVGFGLYQGGKLGAQAAGAYRRALNALLLPRLLSRLEGQMQANMGNTDFLYQALGCILASDVIPADLGTCKTACLGAGQGSLSSYNDLTGVMDSCTCMLYQCACQSCSAIAKAL